MKFLSTQAHLSKHLGLRRQSRVVKVGDLLLGGPARPLIQSMNNTDTRDVETTLRQINDMVEAGVDFTRVAILDMEAANALREISRRSPVPVVADIHFDYRLAIAAVENGAAKIRINPGNIGGRERVRQVADICKAYGVPIRVGVNAGSLSKRILADHGGVTADALVQSALETVAILEDENFDDIVISLKASNPALTIACYRLLASRTDYPLHLGVTEAGTSAAGILRSAVGIGTLLAEGIGDTLRVSLTADPVEEIHAAWGILSALGIAYHGPTLISCPSCGRTDVDLFTVANEVEQRIKNLPYNITVAVMGCGVNGPGEAREADVGLAGGRGEYLLFSQGKILGKVPEENAVNRLMALIEERYGKSQ